MMGCLMQREAEQPVSYIIEVINAISKVEQGKAQKALRMLRRMDKLYQAGNKARPSEITYTAVLNSCGLSCGARSTDETKGVDTASLR
jgi:hypothetical protein